MIAASLAVVPIADLRLAAHPDLIVAFLVLMPTAELLTGHLLVQQFLATGRLSALGLSMAYLFSSMVMVPYAIVFTLMQRSRADSTFSEVCAPWMALAVIGGFPVLAATHRWVLAALPARLSRLAQTRRRAAVATAVAAVLTLAVTVTATIVGAADRLPPFYQSGSPTAFGRMMVSVLLLTTTVSLLAVVRSLRHRPPVERWVVVAISASLATAILFVAAPHRYTLGFYTARVTLLVSSGVVLTALLAETASLYRRLSAAHQNLDQAHRDLSQRAEHLAAANVELEAAGAWKSDVLAALSHEINQPLAVISACSEELKHDWDTATDDERRASVEALGRRVNELLDMAAHLLSLCRAERGQIHTQPVVLPVEQALSRVTENLTSQARGRVVTSYGPPGAAVWADPVHTHQVLTNFVTNAVKYSPGSIHISAALDDTGGKVLFAVSDEGNGVPPAFVAHLFDRFTQDEQAGALRKGAGFGLYLSKLLADVNQGRLWYEDVVPHGSRFVLCLPRAQRGPETAASPNSGDESADRTAGGPFGRGSVSSGSA
ncbi:sensor histidine kinase [Actinoplanes sp. CA-252034]|uniref:sensor histidine kinase n=1 Tax=Actinoplanes sp. CA-252034 TaxID=3239906 RepID=UPI003D98A791